MDHALGRYMSRNQFDRLLRNLRLCQYTADDLKEDPWVPIRGAVKGAWRGLAAKVGDVRVGLPHVTEIARKPEGQLEQNIVLCVVQRQKSCCSCKSKKVRTKC